MKKLKVIVDSHIPYLESLGSVAQVEVLDPSSITPQAVADADALIVRTRTRCDAALLGGSSVKFVATATIGLDHIDRSWCADAGIKVVNAPGCNAPAVAQYVFATALRLINRPLRSYTLGIVGVGNVGRIVEEWARSMNMPVMLCDPPRQAAEGGDCWSSLDDIAAKADIITFHTPLTRGGECPTWHLADDKFFSSLRRAPIIINAARGPVADTSAWLSAIECGKIKGSVVDCWEGEPDINPQLLEMADIATPHIAGYSSDGKKRASQMVIDAFTSHFGLPHLDTGLEIASVPEAVTPRAVMLSYDPMADDEALRAEPQSFEALRNHYDFRPEVRHEAED